MTRLTAPLLAHRHLHRAQGRGDLGETGGAKKKQRRGVTE